MSGCFGGSPFDRHFERQLYDHLSEKSYCEKHDLEFDECKTDFGGCPMCEAEDPELQHILKCYELFGGNFDPGSPKIFMGV